MLSKWILVGLLVMLTTQYIEAQGGRGYGRGGGGGGGGRSQRGYGQGGGGQEEQGGSYTVVYGRPKSTGNMRIDMDVETSEVPVKSIGRKPFDPSRMQVNLGGPEDEPENAARAQSQQGRGGGGGSSGGGGQRGGYGGGGGSQDAYGQMGGGGGGQGGMGMGMGDQSFMDEQGAASRAASEPRTWYRKLGAGNPKAPLFMAASSTMQTNVPVDKSPIRLMPLPGDQNYGNLVDELASEMYSPSGRESTMTSMQSQNFAQSLPKMNKLLHTEKDNELFDNEEALSDLISESLASMNIDDMAPGSSESATEAKRKPADDSPAAISFPLNLLKKSVKSGQGKFIPFISKEGVYGVLVPAELLGLAGPASRFDGKTNYRP